MRRPLDPLLLGSFPAPPTHIPCTPSSPTHIPRAPSSPNPPPSRPPSSPLPPLPPHVQPPPSIDHRLSIADPIDPVTSRRTVFSPSSPRAHSPDIPAILSATPRPRANSLHRSKLLYDLMDAPSDDDDTRSWIDYDDFGRPLPTDFDSDASDSSLDLHTPLPHLMMRHGLLSPQSKLITQSPARDSVVSLASTKKPHPLRDARDTVKRRVRHRDGRLLRGGIGLTTGLGWSDSEDEDAPSALTRRISSLNLTKASSLVLSRSTNSLSSAPSRSSSGTSDYHTSLPSRKSSSASVRPFARSYSSATSLRISADVDEFGNIAAQKSPTATKLSIKTRGSARAIPESEESTGWEQVAQLNTEKNLPPLPRSSVIDSARSIPPRSIGAIRRSSESSAGAATDGRARSISVASRGSTGSSLSVRATITKADTKMLKTPRPLRLASPTTLAPAPLLLAQRQQRPHDRPPVPVPAVSIDTHMCAPPLLESHNSLPSTPSTPSPVTPADRPRPRVGTGMTYRSSAGRMRPPSSSILRSPVAPFSSSSNIHKPIPL